MRDLRLGILDIVLMSLPTGEADIVEVPLWSYEMVLVMPPAYGKGKKSATTFNTSQLPFILYRRAVITDLAFQQFCHDLDLEPNVVIENDEPDSIKQLVKLGLGMTVLPEWSVIDERRERRLTVIRLKNRSFYNYGVLCRRSGYRPKALDDLLAVARRWRDWWPLAADVYDPI